MDISTTVKALSVIRCGRCGRENLHCHDQKTKQDLLTIKRYKFRKGWEKVYKRFQGQFDKTNWKWIQDIPTLVK